MPTVTITNEYDHYFQIYTSIYFDGDVSWQWFKAMAIAESGLDPTAVSPAGAVGIMQIMPGTSAEVSRELWLPDNALDPQSNILMGIHYARKMWDIFKKETGLDRLCFMFGAYNAGPGNIIKAQRLVSRPDIWQEIVAVLSQVTGEHALETIQYVERILTIRQRMIG